jgi:alpha-tubulin suppressor-like RCC1 family protein
VRSASLAFVAFSLCFSVTLTSGCQRGKKPPKVKDITQIASGSGHVCALFRDGALRCWGDDAHGQAGGGPDQKTVLRPQTLSPREKVATIFAGGNTTCALLQGGTSQCWGELSSAGKKIPFDLDGVANLTQFAFGVSHACAVTSTGDAECFGSNAHGELGAGNAIDSAKPLKIAGITKVSQIAVGDAHSCALSEDGTIRCWGDNSKGQLGDGTNESRNVPTLIKGLPRANSIFAGAMHTCAVLSDRSLSCWGDNTHGQLGDGTHDSRSTPRSVSTLTSVGTAALGTSHSCAILSDGTVFCWGDNAHSELADGTRVERTEPVRVSGQYEVKEIVAGNGFTCLRTEEVTRCWGSDATAAIGDWRVSQDPITVPVEVRF